MNLHLRRLLEDIAIQDILRRKLPYMFTVANIENSRGGRVGMEVGNARERIVVSFLTWKLGEQNVKTDIPTTLREVDVLVFGEQVSIKTITGSGGIKASWTVDAASVQDFLHSYRPSCDLLLVQIKWDLTQSQLVRGLHPGGVFHISQETQLKILRQMGPEAYVKPPKLGTNPRGPEITRMAVERLIGDSETFCVDIHWRTASVNITPFTRWIELWQQGES